MDFDQTFAAVIKSMVFKILFAIATVFNLDIDQIDVKTTFLYNFINQLLYIEISKSTESEHNWNMVCRLLKTFYGLQ